MASIFHLRIFCGEKTFPLAAVCFSGSMKSSSWLLPAILTGAFLILTPAIAPASSLSKASIGLQLYSLRNQLAKDVPGTLDEIKSWGITNVELAGTYNL